MNRSTTTLIAMLALTLVVPASVQGARDDAKKPYGAGTASDADNKASREDDRSGKRFREDKNKPDDNNKNAHYSGASSPAQEEGRGSGSDNQHHEKVAHPNDPSARAREAGPDDPSVRARQADSNDPSVQARQTDANDPSVRARDVTADDPSVRAREADSNDPSARAREADSNDPSVRARPAETNESNTHPDPAHGDGTERDPARHSDKPVVVHDHVLTNDAASLAARDQLVRQILDRIDQHNRELTQQNAANADAARQELRRDLLRLIEAYELQRKLE